jgi:hypothetical protein
MKQCDYFACTEEVHDADKVGLEFCCYHLRCLESVVSLDLKQDTTINSVAYCFAALNSKSYIRDNTIL